MKKLVLVFLAILITVIAYSQDCSSVKFGKFKIVFEADTFKVETIITRTKDIQIEEVSDGTKLQFHVKWTSPCSYELSKPKVLKGNLEHVADDQVLFVKILKVTPDFYTAEMTSNFADVKATKDIQILH
jgi:inosine/xanthosine triphosphate pyrophosphatase family protein